VGALRALYYWGVKLQNKNQNLQTQIKKFSIIYKKVINNLVNK
jgi:hypothetical protein